MYLPRRQLTNGRQYGTSLASAPSTARGNNNNFTRFSCSRLVQRSALTFLDRCPSAGFSPRIPGRRIDTATPASTSSPRAPPSPVTKFAGAMPATKSCASSAAPLSQSTGAFALSAIPPATRSRTSSAGPLSYVFIKATGACASGAAPLSLGTRVHTPSVAPPNHVPRSSQTEASSRRSFQRGCPTHPPFGNAVAVGLRCGKADTETPISRMQFGLVFPRNNGGRSTLFPVEVESTRSATSSPFPSRPTVRKPSPVDTLLPPTQPRFGRRLLGLQTLFRLHAPYPTCAQFSFGHNGTGET